jgi:hypothetical protein
MEEIDNKKKESLFKKKVSILGKAVPVMLIIGLLMVGGASAALVAYLSNSIGGSVSVVSPLDFKLLSASVGTTPITVLTNDHFELKAIHGGDTLNLETEITNEAANPIEVYPVVIELSGPGNWWGTEFESVNLIEQHGSDPAIYRHNILPFLCAIDSTGAGVPFKNIKGTTWESTSIRLIAGTPTGEDSVDCSSTGIVTYTQSVGSSINNKISIKTAEALKPTVEGGPYYELKMCHLDDLKGPCQ